MPINLASFVLLLAASLLVPAAAPASADGQSQSVWDPVYQQALSQDLAAWERLRAEIAGGGLSMAAEPPEAEVSLDILSVDGSEFPRIGMFVSAKDQHGEHIPGLTAEKFILRVQHPKDGTALGKTLSSFTMEEVGEVDTSADIVFIIDSTGSMSSAIDVVRSNVIAFVNQLVEKKVDYRLAGYHFGDEVPYRGFKPFTADADSFKGWVSSLSASGGDDTPENPLDSIIAAGSLPYRPDAQHIVVLITDAPAHVAGDEGDSETNATFSAAGRAMAGLAFYYSSPEGQYASLGSSLGWPFSADTLLGVLGEDITGKYLVRFTDPMGVEDGMTRRVHFALRADSSRFAEAEYTPEQAKFPLPGKVTNNDPVPAPIADALVEARELKSGELVSTHTDAKGEFSLEMPVFSDFDWWEVRAKKDPDYGPVKQDVIPEQQESGDWVATPARLDFALPRSTVAAEKRRLRALAQKNGAWGTVTSTPFSDEAAAVISWLDTIPDQAAGGAGPTDAQREGLKRLIQAHLSLALGNSYATEDANTIGASVSEVIVSVLDLTGVFDRLAGSINGLVGKMDADHGNWLKRKTVGMIKRILGATADKLVMFKIKVVNAILTGVKWALSDSPAATTIITVIQDALAASGGDVSLKGIVNSVVAPAIARQIVTPIYATAMEPPTRDSLSRSQAITAADFDAMAAAIRASAAKLDAVRANFDTLKGRLGTVATFKNVVGQVKDIVDALKTLERPLRIVGAIPVLTPVVVEIEVNLDMAYRVLVGLDALGSVVNGGLAGGHLWGLPGESKTAMLRAYDPAYTPASAGHTGATGAYYTPSPARLTAAAADTGLGGLNSAVAEAIDALRGADMERFVDVYSDTLLPAMAALADNLEVLAAQTDAGMGVDGRPVNYDLLAQDARAGYTGLLSRMLGYTSAMTGLTLGELLSRQGFDDSAPSRTAREELEGLLLSLQASAQRGAEALITATDAVRYDLPAVVHLGPMTASIAALDDATGAFDLSVHAKNVGDRPAGDVSLTLIPPRLALEDGGSRDLVTVLTPAQTLRGLAAGAEGTVSWRVQRSSGEPVRSDLYTFQVRVGDHPAGTAVTGAGVLTLAARPSDRDGDGMPDYWEEAHGLDPDRPDANQDADGERLVNGDEYRFGYDPQRADTDGDGMDDWKEHLMDSGYAGKAGGDLDGDGRVNQVDLDMARAAWGLTGTEAGFPPAADMDGNGRIEVQDLMVIGSRTGTDF